MHSRCLPCQVLGWTLVNSTVALAGYYFSAFTVDKPYMGRRRLQVRDPALRRDPTR